MSFTNRFTAEQLIHYIGHSYVELSYDKVQAEYHYHRKICRDWLNSRPLPPPEPEQFTLPFYGPDGLDF